MSKNRDAKRKAKQKAKLAHAAQQEQARLEGEYADREINDEHL